MSSGLSSLPRDAPFGPRTRRPQRTREREQGAYTCASSFYQITYTSTMCLLLLRPPRNARQRARLGRYVTPTPFLSTNALILCKKLRPMLPPSPFDALLNARRLYRAVSLRPPRHTLYIAPPYRQASGSTAPRPFINDTVRTRRGFINGRYEPPTTGACVPPC
ncbi:hypothetical protein B0H14DRAFT_716771 [Mycena olivaceomarginata]|nr:hypothetical protein B0H14DRAFT_716771 [Mycena olivaceomarginata]